MVKTRSQILKSPIEKEEREEKPKQEQSLHNINNATKKKSKITKNKTLIQVQITKPKSENEEQPKANLASSFAPPKARTKYTPEQITNLINYIVNDKMNLVKAAKKAGITQTTAYQYYYDYLNDPEHKIPLPKTLPSSKPPATLTQKKLEDLIHYIVNNKMNLSQASKKADISRATAAKYYAKYLEDPERKIPLLHVRPSAPPKTSTQEEITDLINYIIRDKMTIVKASKKVNMSHYAAKRYYLQYLHDPDHKIPDTRGPDHHCGKHCPDEQVSSLIGYIVNDGMTLIEASVKANMSNSTARKYYYRYLDDPESYTPTSELNSRNASLSYLTVDQIRNFFHYIIVDKLKIAQAARKVKISKYSAQIYYHKYLKSPSSQIEIKDMSYTVEKMKQFVDLVKSEKMSVKKAADAVNLNYSSAKEHYKQYLKDPDYEFPEKKNNRYTREEVEKLIKYIEHGKMSTRSAARKIKMNPATAHSYYKKYQNDPEQRIPVPVFNGEKRKKNMADTITQIIADIYKNNPSITPIYETHDPKLNTLDKKIKTESVEEDTNMLFKTENE